jgi:hypothetical protein
MKKLLLSLAVVASSVAAIAQNCTPLQTWADTVDYGAYPDTIVNFPSGVENVFYTADLNFKVPAEVTAELDPSGDFVGSPIESFIVTGVTGLPTGFNFACNIASCEYLGGANGCANVYGTTADVGLYDVTIDVTATIIINVLGFPVPVEQPTQFTGYKILIDSASTASVPFQVIEPLAVSPNPSSNKVTLSGVSPSLKASQITVTDITGKIVHTIEPGNYSNYTFDVSGLDAGIYVINVEHAYGFDSIKFIKE